MRLFAVAYNKRFFQKDKTKRRPSPSYYRETERSKRMTFYEWIRACLLKDAEKHPYPGRFCAPAPPAKREAEKKPEKKEKPP